MGFYDLPGCIASGDNFKSAYDDAARSLGMHLYGMYKDDERIPAASSDVGIYPATAAGYLISPVSIYPKLVKDELDNKAVKTNITLPQWLKYWAVSENINLSQTLQAVLKDMYRTSGESRTVTQKQQNKKECHRDTHKQQKGKPQWKEPPLWLAFIIF